MRSKGLSFYWYDAYRINLFAQEFEKPDNVKFDLMIALEVFEHLPDPIHEIEKILELSDSIFFTTCLQPKPFNEDWWYLSITDGQHVSFHTVEFLTLLGKKFGLNYYRYYDTHLLTPKVLEEPFKASFAKKVSRKIARSRLLTKPDIVLLYM